MEWYGFLQNKLSESDLIYIYLVIQMPVMVHCNSGSQQLVDTSEIIFGTVLLQLRRRKKERKKEIVQKDGICCISCSTNLQTINDYPVHNYIVSLSHVFRELRSCVKVEVDVLGSPSVIVRAVSVDVKQHWRRWCSLSSILILSPSNSPPPPPPDLKCDFEQSLCLWTNSNITGAKLQWHAHRGTTPTPLTGPDNDHTLGNGELSRLNLFSCL